MKKSVGEDVSKLDRFAQEERDSLRVCALCPAALLLLVFFIRLAPATMAGLGPALVKLPYPEVIFPLIFCAIVLLGAILFTGCMVFSVMALFHDVSIPVRISVSAFNLIALLLGERLLLDSS
ncbi:MAG: hypothetical protein AAF488_08525 [Planctomycetota bacterium]